MEFNWSAYWQEPGRKTSFRDGPLASFYEGQEFAALFNELITELRDGDHVLDLACGNGAALEGIRTACRQSEKSLRLHGIDKAHIHPPEELAEHVAFVRGVTEKLPYAEKTFRRAVSCFGIEFTDVQVSLKEIHRVLRDRGQFTCLMYAVESSFIRRLTIMLDVFDHGLGDLIAAAESPEASVRADSSKSWCKQQADSIRTYIVENVEAASYQAYLYEILGTAMHLATACDNSMTALSPKRDTRGEARRIEREFAWMRAIRQAAVPSCDARQMVRIAHFSGFAAPCVVPFEIQGNRLGWLLQGDR